MVALVPMTASQFSRYLAETVPSYAAENVRSGRWSESEALTEAQKQIDSLLPNGVETPNHFLFEIRAVPTGPRVGSTWLAVEPRGAFVYDLQIDEAHRRQGHAEAAMRALEGIARDRGAKKISLHVFGTNTTARHLYRKLGYDETNVMMSKAIEGPADKS